MQGAVTGSLRNTFPSTKRSQTCLLGLGPQPAQGWLHPQIPPRLPLLGTHPREQGPWGSPDGGQGPQGAFLLLLVALLSPASMPSLTESAGTGGQSSGRNKATVACRRGAASLQRSWVDSRLRRGWARATRHHPHPPGVTITGGRVPGCTPTQIPGACVRGKRGHPGSQVLSLCGWDSCTSRAVSAIIKSVLFGCSERVFKAETKEEAGQEGRPQSRGL